ncbi:MAG: hypothetical protein [Cressdnaviricota sp.]|nr:MAG: hypothetical protein [Cressdnaviricota sp.]
MREVQVLQDSRACYEVHPNSILTVPRYKCNNPRARDSIRSSNTTGWDSDGNNNEALRVQDAKGQRIESVQEGQHSLQERLSELAAYRRRRSIGYNNSSISFNHVEAKM